MVARCPVLKRKLQRLLGAVDVWNIGRPNTRSKNVKGGHCNKVESQDVGSLDLIGIPLLLQHILDSPTCDV